MKRIRIMGLCLVAALALSVAAASSAFAAAPEFITKAGIGGVGGSVKVQQETVLGVPKGMGAGTLEGQVSKVKIACKDVKGETTGEITGPKTSQKNVTLFKECSTAVGNCYSIGKTNEIETFSLEGELGNLPTGKPGERFFREGSRGAPLAEFECGGGLLSVKSIGSVVAALSTTGVGATPEATKLEKTTKVEFVESKGVQKYNSLEPPALGPAEQLESAAALYIAETAIEWPWTGSGTGPTIKVKCGTGEGVLGELIDSHYEPAAPFKLPAADNLKYYTVKSITKYEETMYFLVVIEGYPVGVAEGIAKAELVETAVYGPCAGTEKSGESYKVTLESTPYKEDIGVTL